MTMETLNSSVGSLVKESLFSEMDDADYLLRRLSPYATLRPGDLSALMRLQRQTPGLSSLKAASFFSEAFAERSDSDAESEKDETSDECETVVVRGQDIGDLPAEYVVRGLRPREMPVIGVYVDPRILPGFRYRVRHAGSAEGPHRYLFDGKAMTLQSIGLGYGKRMTFSSDSHLFNENYFWSDSDPNGFALSLEAVRPGDQLTIYGNNGFGVIGEVKVEKTSGPQEEISSEVVKGDVIKRVRVTMQLSVTYHQHVHGKSAYKLYNMETVTGEAVIIKKRRSRVAELDSVHNIHLSCCNEPCTLQVES